VKLHIAPISTRSSDDHPYYPLTATGSEEELLVVINQVILDDEGLEQESVRCEIMGLFPDDSSLPEMVKWVNRHSNEIEVQLQVND
jgi:hypothetical protein